MERAGTRIGLVPTPTLESGGDLRLTHLILTARNLMRTRAKSVKIPNSLKDIAPESRGLTWWRPLPLQTPETLRRVATDVVATITLTWCRAATITADVVATIPLYVGRETPKNFLLGNQPTSCWPPFPIWAIYARWAPSMDGFLGSPLNP